MIIRINKLFGRFNSEVDLSKRCTIFIGENGIGKSTTIKILNNIINMKYDELIKYNFESFDVNNIRVYYKDLIPSKYEIIDYYLTKDLYNDTENRFDENGYTKEDFRNDGLSKHEALEILFDQLKDSEYYEIIRSSINGKYSISLKKKLSSLIYYKPIFQYVNGPKSFLEEIKNVVLKFINDKKTSFYKSDNYNKLIFKEYTKSFSLNMVRDYKIINSEEKLINNKFDSNIRSQSESIYDINNYRKNYKLIGKRDYIESNLESFNKIQDYNYFIDNGLEINISKILFNISYKKEDLLNVIEKYYLHVVTELTEGDISEVQNNSVGMYDTVLNKEDRVYIEDYINPLLPKDSLFDVDYSEELYINNIYNNFVKSEGFLTRRLPLREKLKKLQMLFDKYFYNKKVTVTPSRIIVSNNFNDYEDIGYDLLSEGERKLIIIFTLCTLYDDVVLFLDEPETSLSLIWQETLIPDLLEYTNVKNIIVATQSPYIAVDDNLIECINPIIDEGENLYD